MSDAWADNLHTLAESGMFERRCRNISGFYGREMMVSFDNFELTTHVAICLTDRLVQMQYVPTTHISHLSDR
jgi:hypothetical protein